MIHFSGKRFAYIFCVLLFSGFVNAQIETFVIDQENIFTKEEATRIDTMLRAYHQTSGNMIVVCTDTMDINSDQYKAKLEMLLFADTSHIPRTIYISFSRRTGQVIVNGFNLKGIEKWDDLIPIFDAGMESLKEKRLEEAAMLMSRKAMEIMDALPDE